MEKVVKNNTYMSDECNEMEDLLMRSSSITEELDPLNQYLTEMGNYPLLDAEREYELACLSAAGDLDARRELVNCNLRLVVHIAKQYRNRGMELLDLIQMGNEGLMRAIRKFEPAKGNRLSTYSTWWIRQAITRGIYENSRTVRLPVHMSEKMNQYKSIVNALSADSGREPREEEIEREYAVCSLKKKHGGSIPAPSVVDRYMSGKAFRDEIRLIRENLQMIVSLDMPVGEKEEDVIGDFIHDDMNRPETIVEDMLLEESLAAVLGTLPEREAQILRWRYIDQYTLEQCGERMHVTRERVRQLENKALLSIRRNPVSMGMLQGFCNVG